MLFATAEAVVALAAIAEKVRASRLDQPFTIVFGRDSAEWVSALQLNQISEGTWDDRDTGWAMPTGCHAYHLHRITLENRDHAAARANALVKAIQLLPEGIFGGDRNTLLASVERVAYEAFLNIVEHAYTEKAPKHAYVCATVTPPNYFDDAKDLATQVATPEELTWLRENNGAMILEIAIADAGQGVPRTLWRDAEKKGRAFAANWKAVLDQQGRTAAQQSLCEYAFHHDSTRKEDNEFKSSASRLSWRGLHSALRQTESLAGCILLASGRGRAGYVSVNNRLTRISPQPSSPNQFPGTLVLLRFSTEPKRSQLASARRTGKPLQLRIGYLASEQELIKGLPLDQVARAMVAPEDIPKNRVTDSIAITEPPQLLRPLASVLVAYFPFRSFTDEQKLMTLLPALPPNHVAVLLFADVPADIRAQLRAYAETEWSPITHGTPRLLCLWDRDYQCFRWQFAGELPLPRRGQKLYSDLESLGRAELTDETPEVHALARDLAAAYPEFLIWEEHGKSLSFVSVEAVLAPEDHDRLLNDAFQLFYDAEPKPFVWTCSEGEAIRMPTGRLVTQFLSVLSLLRSAPQVASALSYRFREILQRLSETQEISLYADGSASYFVANHLLESTPDPPQVKIFDRTRSDRIHGTPILFVDVIFSGETINRVIKQLDSVSDNQGIVIACVDMRRLPTQVLQHNNWKVEALLRFHFDAGGWKSTSEPKRVFEVDLRTHVPFDTVALCEFTELGTTVKNAEFLRMHPSLFVFGFHQVGGRVHTVSLPTQQLVRDHADFLVEAIADEGLMLFASLTEMPATATLVIFCRPESKIYPVVSRIAEELRRRLPHLGSVFISHLSVGPMLPKLVFPRQEESLLADMRDAFGQMSLFPPEQIGDFIGIYLDDASITGKTLQDFITKATCLTRPTPKALLAILVVNRLSPREVRFLKACANVSCSLKARLAVTSTHNVPFRLGSLFRLQVKDSDAGEPESAPRIIRQLADNSEFFDKRLQAYTDAIVQRIGKVFLPPDDRSEESNVVMHPFYPHETVANSFPLSTIRLRQLLALNAQNEGVISDVLKAVTELVESKETSLLAMLALESNLLRHDPLAVECWPNLRDFCFEVLNSAEPAECKSDALAVLCHRREDFVAGLGRVLPLVAPSADLLTQTAAFLLSFTRRDLSWREKVRKSLDSSKDRVPVQAIDWMRAILDTPERIAATYVVRDESEAVAKIHALISATWTHVGLEEWQAFDRNVKNLIRGPHVFTRQELALGKRCIEYCERYLLSGMAGIRFIALKKSRSQDAARLAKALVAAMHAGITMRHLLAPDAAKEATWRSDLTDTWNELRRLTLKGATPVRVLGQVKEVSEEPSLIEEILPHIYSAPHPLIQKLARRFVPTLTIKADPNDFLKSAVIVPVSRHVVNEFCRILLDNMAKYGDPHHCSCDFECRDTEGGVTLYISLTDRTRAGVAKGEGAGIPLLEEYSRRGGFNFSYLNQRDEFVVTTSFPNALKISPQMTRR